jgi:hypothetical protein
MFANLNITNYSEELLPYKFELKLDASRIGKDFVYAMT